MLQDFNITYLNPFNTLQFGKIISLPPGGHYTVWKVTFTLKFSKNYLKSVTLTVTCVRVFPGWDLIWVQKEGKYGPLW